jgi:hypothetical protein
MRLRGVARVRGAARRSAYPIGLILMAALAAGAGGCSSLPQNGRMTLASAAGPVSTIAFESIDGPPPEVFRKLVASLNDEAGTRKIAVVSRDSAATYRIRGYVSALVERDKTTFAWVWDVYDTDKRRALRLSGEEPVAAGRRRDVRTAAGARSAAAAWIAADDQLVRRMARSGMEQMAGFLNSDDPPLAAAPTPEPSLATLVSGRDDSPEGAGIFRLLGGKDQPAQAAATAADVPPPEPPKIAPKSKKTRSASAAATDGRSPRP